MAILVLSFKIEIFDIIVYIISSFSYEWEKIKKHLTVKIIVNRMVSFFDVTSQYFKNKNTTNIL